MMLKWVEQVLTNSLIHDDLKDQLINEFKKEYEKTIAFTNKNDEHCLVRITDIATIFCIRSKKSTVITLIDGEEYAAKGILDHLTTNELFTQLSSTLFVNSTLISNYNSRFGIIYFKTGLEMPIDIRSIPIIINVCGKDKDTYDQSDYSPKKNLNPPLLILESSNILHK
ncbi:hypothetical protein WMW72_05990 [Paenibacillus filicis]|uniref:Uncharacterized protein n=1 Tax=Paenibacillus filicis TaxID=669464 RepID=A0ABU9DF14_9BACL